MRKEDILDLFDGAQLLKLDGPRFVLRLDDVVISGTLDALDICGYDEYLIEIRDLMRERVAALNAVKDGLNDIKNNAVVKLVSDEIERVAYGTIRRENEF